MFRFVCCLFPFLLAVSCVKAPVFPDEPVLTFEGLSKNQIYQFTNGPLDSITIHFSFTDGDGDISQLGNDTISDIFLEDSRIPGFVSPASLPLVPQEGTGNGISGDIFFTIINQGQAVCCIVNNRFCLDDPNTPIDTFSYLISIRDRAGNVSNQIRTSTIEVLCNNQ